MATLRSVAWRAGLVLAALVSATGTEARALTIGTNTVFLGDESDVTNTTGNAGGPAVATNFNFAADAYVTNLLLFHFGSGSDPATDVVHVQGSNGFSQDFAATLETATDAATYGIVEDAVIDLTFIGGVTYTVTDVDGASGWSWNDYSSPFRVDGNIYRAINGTTYTGPTVTTTSQNTATTGAGMLWIQLGTAPTEAPEPGTLGVVALGALGFAGRRRGRKLA